MGFKPVTHYFAQLLFLTALLKGKLSSDFIHIKVSLQVLGITIAHVDKAFCGS